MSIPIPLLQYWHDSDPPPGVRRRMAGWAEDPDFEVTVLDDTAAASFLRAHFDRATLRGFESCAVPAMRADFFRYAWLYVHGGAYVDADVRNLGGAADVFRATDRGCLFLRAETKQIREGWRPGKIPNGLMYLRQARDPAMAYALEQATQNVMNRISNDVWEVTGPGILTKVWGEGGQRAEEFFAGFTIHSFREVAKSVGKFGHMPFKERDSYWVKFRDDPSHGSIFRDPSTDAEEDDLRLPSGGRLLHVGPHKTGSTAIQGALEEVRGRLPEHGAGYVELEQARKAAWSLGVRGGPGRGPWRPSEELWHQLVDEVREAGERRVCISNEDFGRAEPSQIRRIVDGLGGEEPHVVAVVRRLDKLLPSLWQQRVKVGSPLGYEAWLRAVLDRPDETYDWEHAGSDEEIERSNAFYPHDTPTLLRRWGDVVGLDRITLVVSDDRDRSFLPRTFERMLGLPEGMLALQPGQSNQSLAWSDVEFVRAINEALIARKVPRKDRRRLVSRGLVHELMGRPVSDEVPRTPPLPPWAASLVQEVSAKRIAAIDELGVRVVGDLEALRPGDVPTGDPSRPPAIDGAAAARAVDWLIAELLPGGRP